ncbi:MAG: hypothetical protein ABFD52_05020 [Acidobacteriota bacterium]
MELFGRIGMPGKGGAIDLDGATAIKSADVMFLFSGARAFRLDHEQKPGVGRPEDTVAQDYWVALCDGKDVAVGLTLSFEQARQLRDVLAAYCTARAALVGLREAA